MRDQKVFNKQLTLPTACMMFPDQMVELAVDLLDDADDADELRSKVNDRVDEIFPGGCPQAEYQYRVLEMWKLKHGICFRTNREGDRIVWMKGNNDWEGAHEYTKDGWQPYEGEMDEPIHIEHVAATPAPTPSPFKTVIRGPWPHEFK